MTSPEGPMTAFESLIEHSWRLLILFILLCHIVFIPWLLYLLYLLIREG